MCAAGLDLAFENEKNLSAGKNSWKIIFAELGKLCIPLIGSFLFINTNIKFVYSLVMA